MSIATTTIDALPRISNPFSTRWVRPGALPYQFPPNTSAQQFLEQLRHANWRGAIVGPHGTGKSALLATITLEIERSGRTVRTLALHDGQRHLPKQFPLPQHLDPLGVLIVDGFEQLGWRARRLLHQCCRATGWGLLITAHADRAANTLPILFRTTTDISTLQQLIHHHLPSTADLISPFDIAVAFANHHGNIREAFFTLYDLFENRRRALSSCG